MSLGRVLILDDDRAVGDTLALLARRAGYEVRFTTSAERFFADEEEWRPTHIVVDLVMPGLDGIEVLRELRHRRSDAGIIITSGFDARVLEAAERAGSQGGLRILGGLRKPFLSAAFRALLNGDRGRLPACLLHPGKPGNQRSAELNAGHLRDALDASAIDVAFQPKIRCSDDVVTGFEALARWPSGPGGQPVPPTTFIPLAEQAGLIARLTDQVVRKALSWLRANDLHAQLSLNLSPCLLDDLSLADRLAEMVHAMSIDPSRIVFEVTETGALAAPEATLDVATRLRLKGFALAMDDFGIGYSSLVQLARLPFSELKIDALFVESVTRSEESRKIVRAVTGLGHSLGLSVTAEGVETKEALQFICETGCDAIQGFYIAHPLGGLEVQRWLQLRSFCRPAQS